MTSLRPVARPMSSLSRSWAAKQLGQPTSSSSLFRNSSTLPRRSASASSSSSGNASYRATRAGVAFSLALTLVIGAYSLHRFPIQLEAAPAPQHAAASLLPPSQTSQEDDFHIDSATSQKLPRRIEPPASLASGSGSDKADSLVLLASGVRTVSFLRVQVYVAALYVLERPFEDFMKSQGNAGGSSSSGDGESLEQTMRQALEAGVPMVLKIVPVKNTDFAHLRDGFTRAVQLRQKYLRKTPTPPSEEQEESLSLSLQRLKECFPKASLKKGEHLDLVFQPSRVTAPSAGAAGGKGVDLAFEHDRVVLGTVQYDTRGGNMDVARLLFQAYVADKDPVSEVFKKAVSQKIFPPPQ